ncbi:MAG: hypothetical protein JNL79_15785 [Myxococcales bacterium]|nr:hypothetical protein [Myxococcales bacterium]
MRRWGALAVAPLLSAGPAAAAEVWTATRDVRACAVVDAHVVLAATTGGVVRVKDGAIERVYTALDGLPDTQASALLVEPDGAWIGTEGGLARLANGVVSPKGKGHPHVRALLRSGSSLYAGTWGEGLLRLDGDALAPLAFAAPGPLGRSKVSSLVAHEGSLVAGTMGGAYRLEGGALRAVVKDGPLDVFALGTHGGRLWIGALDGVRTLGPGGLRFEANDDVRAFAATGSDLWAGAFSSGLLHPGKAGLVKLPLANVPGHVQALGVSAAARCVGTREGLFVGVGSGALAPVTRAELPSNDLVALAAIGARTFVGTYDHGLAVIEGGVVKVIAGVDPRVNALAVDGEKLWVGTARGLYAVDAKNAVVAHVGEIEGLPAGDVHALAPLAGGGVFVGTAKGAALVRGGAVTVLGKKQGLGGEAAWAVLETPDGSKWVGTSAGLFVLRKAAKVWERYSHVSGHLPDDWVTALVARGDKVFVGTYAGGVVEATLGQKLTATPLGGGMVNLAGLSFDGDTLLVATMDGLLSRKASGPLVARSGALGRDVTAALRTPSGLFVASRRGLSRVP